MIVQANPDYASITPVIEKEILHHDIMSVLMKQGAMHKLTFIGGTALRMCYKSSRLSEDLDFNGGFDFKPTDFNGLEFDIKDFIEKKYETEVWVSKSSAVKQGDTVSWKISIEKESNRPDLPRQKLHIDVCAIPSFDVVQKPLLNHYAIDVPTEGILISVQSREEMLADKMIALAYRARRIKPRDVWDIVWMQQRGVSLSTKHIFNKLSARRKDKDDFIQALSRQVETLLSDPMVKNDFYMEMSRFIPSKIKEKTLDNPNYWPYIQSSINEITSEIILGRSSRKDFDMGM